MHIYTCIVKELFLYMYELLIYFIYKLSIYICIHIYTCIFNIK